jgi:HEPN domain-containing protein
MSELQARRELVQAWLDSADRDYRAAEKLSLDQAFFAQVILFHCQQCAEKSLKGYLQWSDIRFPKTHDLTLLLSLCLELATEFGELEQACQDLRSLAVDSRYPMENPETELLEADAAMEHAAHVHDFVMLQLPSAATAP